MIFHVVSVGDDGAGVVGMNLNTIVSPAMSTFRVVVTSAIWIEAIGFWIVAQPTGSAGSSNRIRLFIMVIVMFATDALRASAET